MSAIENDSKENLAHKHFRERFTKKYLSEIKTILDQMENEFVSGMDNLATILFEARVKKNTVFVMGNGGSASTASHFVADISKGTIVEGFPRFKAIALNDNIPNMLAWGNDSSYEDIFAEQLINLMEPGDVVIGISGSGNSMNVIKAIEYANGNEGITVGISGYDGGKLLKCAQVNIHVPSFCIQMVEDVHLIIGHLLSSMIKEEDLKAIGGS